MHPSLNAWIVLSPLSSLTPTGQTHQVYFSFWLPSPSHPADMPLPDSKDRLTHLKALAPQLCEPLRSAILWLPDDLHIPSDAMTYMPTLHAIPTEHAHCVALAGDAAHPLTPYRGQGLNNAVQDASNLVAAIKRVAAGQVELREALVAYGGEVRARASAEAAASYRAVYSAHHFEALMESPLVKLGQKRMPVPVVQ